MAQMISAAPDRRFAQYRDTTEQLSANHSVTGISIDVNYSRVVSILNGNVHTLPHDGDE